VIRKQDLAHISCGFLMGGADVVPGISGGTVALILGIYDRLVRAVSRFDTTLLAHVRKGEWRAAARYVDLRFLATLGTGIAVGILGLASLMHYLLEDQEYVAVHSINRSANVLRLNVGTQTGGIEPGALLTVHRRKRDREHEDRYERIGAVRLQRYLDSRESAGTVRPAVAQPVGELTVAELRMDDVVTQPSTRRPFTLAVFFGLILGSSVLVGRMLPRWTVAAVLSAPAGTAFAFWLVGQFPVAPAEGNLYLFVCGMLAICAMILPGISGAFILLILGVYAEVTGLLRSVLSQQATPATLISIGVFCLGCAVGLLSFSKLLNWLLCRHRVVTLAGLCGFMAGSLRKIWPFKHDLTPDRAQLKFKLFNNVPPDLSDTTTWMIFAAMAAAAVCVFLLDWLTDGHDHQPHLDDAGVTGDDE